MKMKRLEFVVISVFVTFVTLSCSQSELELRQNETAIEQVREKHDQEMQDLIRFVQEAKLQPAVPMQIESQTARRSWFSWFRTLGKADGGAYRWGRDNGFSVWQSLRVAATVSIVTAINGDNTGTEWRVGDEWRVYPSTIRDYQRMGNMHNQVIYELCRQNPNIKYGSSISSDAVYSLVDKKVNALGNGDGLTFLQRSKLTIMLDEVKQALNSSRDVSTVFMQGFGNSRADYLFLDEFVESVLLLDTRSEQVEFAESVYKKIDTMSTVNKDALKNMVSISLCSVNLWQPL